MYWTREQSRRVRAARPEALGPWNPDLFRNLETEGPRERLKGLVCMSEARMGPPSALPLLGPGTLSPQVHRELAQGLDTSRRPVAPRALQPRCPAELAAQRAHSVSVPFLLDTGPTRLPSISHVARAAFKVNLNFFPF